MFRIGLFLISNIAILLIVSIVFQVLGLEPILAANGVDLNLSSLLIMCALMGFGGSFISLFLSKWLAKRGSGTKIIETPKTEQERWLVQTVEQLAKKAGIAMPEVGIFPSQQSNAFATGWNKNAALVAVSDGLLARFSQDEARAVLAHEIGHVANGDMVTLSLVQGVVNTFVLFFARIIGQMVDRLIFKNERGLGIGYFIGSMLAQVVLGVLASMIVMWFSRYREFRADAAGAELADRQSMIKALQRLKAEYEIPNDLPQELTAFGINSNWKAQASKLFSSHPPLDNRIEALLKDSV